MANEPSSYAVRLRATERPSGPPSLDVSLDIARGLAAMAVFCFHINGMIGDVWPSLVQLAKLGHMGVPIFFVISGYCMAASAHQVIVRGGAAGSFLRKRFLRIFPPYWASILAVMFVPYALAGLSALKTGVFVRPEAAWQSLSAVDWVQFLTLTRVFFAGEHGLDNAFNALNIVYWTLAIEFQFYLVMAFALWWRRRYTVVLWLTTAASLVALGFPQVKATGLFIGYWPMFALGLGLHYLVRSRHTLAAVGWVLPPALSLVGVAVVVGLSGWMTMRGMLSDLLQTIFGDLSLGFAALAAVALWLMADSDRQLTVMARQGPRLVRWSLKAGVFLGTISYSIYLLHAKLHQLPLVAARQVFDADQPGYVILVVAGTILISWLFFRWFEAPFISRRPVAPIQSIPADARA